MRLKPEVRSPDLQASIHSAHASPKSGGALICIVVSLAVLVSSCGERQKAEISPKETAEKEAKRLTREADEKRQLAELDQICTPGSTLHVEAERQVKKGKPEIAYDTLSVCGELLSRQPVLDELHTKASVAARRRIEEKERQAAVAERSAARALKKKSGVSTGMSKRDVLDSSWGKPQRVNRTTNAGGVFEQWVYPSGNYLYFSDEVLTSIQN